MVDDNSFSKWVYHILYILHLITLKSSLQLFVTHYWLNIQSLRYQVFKGCILSTWKYCRCAALYAHYLSLCLTYLISLETLGYSLAYKIFSIGLNNVLNVGWGMFEQICLGSWGQSLFICLFLSTIWFIPLIYCIILFPLIVPIKTQQIVACVNRIGSGSDSNLTWYGLDWTWNHWSKGSQSWFWDPQEANGDWEDSNLNLKTQIHIRQQTDMEKLLDL